MESGSGTVTGVTTTTKSMSIPFSKAFATIPNVVVCLGSSGSYNRRINVSSVTTTGFSIETALLSGSTSANTSFYWIAHENG